MAGRKRMAGTKNAVRRPRRKQCEFLVSGPSGLFAMNVPLSVQQIGAFTVVQITTISLMDPPMLEDLGQRLYQIVDEQDKRMIILDFERVQYMSSQAIGILLALHKKLSNLS